LRLKIAEQSEVKLRVKNKNKINFDTKLCFVVLALLRSAIFSKIKMDSNFVTFAQELIEIRRKIVIPSPKKCVRRFRNLQRIYFLRKNPRLKSDQPVEQIKKRTPRSTELSSSLAQAGSSRNFSNSELRRFHRKSPISWWNAKNERDEPNLKNFKLDEILRDFAWKCCLKKKKIFGSKSFLIF